MPLDIALAGYDLHKEIGSGGMARVFLATQISLNREVAIKVLRRSLASGEDFQRRFLHEAQMLAKLIHPNIVSIHDIGQTTEVSYMAMEFLRGGTLSEHMANGLSVSEVIRICTQIAHALDLAHRQKIVHRDLKPSNIMFRDELTPVLTDFGIARQTDADHRLTKTGMVVGTPFYMSPEQVTGRAVDGRADIYSLGIMFYELLTGELPFRASEPLALAIQHMQEPPPPLPQDLSALQPLLDLMLAKNPEQRYPNMLAFCQAIKDLVMSEQAFRAKLSTETKLFNSDQFSDPRFGSGGLRVPERVTRDIARATSEQGQPATAVRGTPIPKPRARASIGWKLPTLAAIGLAIVGLSIYLGIFSTGGGLSAADQKLVENLLARANAHITLNQIETPAGKNAVDTLKTIFEIAPDYPDALALAEEVALFFEADAKLALNADDLVTARNHVERGLAIAPSYRPLLEVKRLVDEQLAAEQKRSQIAVLLAAASEHMAEERFTEPPEGNAYTSYQAILQLDPVNESASRGLKNIQERLVATARLAIAEQRLTEAHAIVDNTNALFQRSALVAQVQQELNDAERMLAEQRQVAQLEENAERHMQAQHYVEPANDNALEDFLAILGVQPDNNRALAGLNAIADHFETLSTSAFATGDYTTSLAFARNGLRATPERASLLETQQRATNALGDLERRIEQQLQQAERLAQSGRYLSSDDANALAAYRQVLTLDQDNARATEAIAGLPVAVYAEADRLLRSGQLEDAETLLTQATDAFPTESSRFAPLQRQVATRATERQRSQRLTSLLQQSERLIDVRPLTNDAVEQAAQAIKQVLTEFPNDVTAISQYSGFIRAITTQAEVAVDTGNEEQAMALVDFGLTQFPGSDSLTAARAHAESRWQQRLQEAAAQQAARSGQLVIDATPWGEVVALTDATGNDRELPPDSTTPLVISLLEGDYSVLVKGASNAPPVRIEVTVERQTTVATRADFSFLDADSYFERSGW